MSALPKTREYEEYIGSSDGYVTFQLADAMKGELLARMAALEAENERLRSVLGSVAEHDRSFGAHIAAAMKKYDAERGGMVSKQDAAATQVTEKALAAVKAGRAEVEWGATADIETVASDGRWGPLKMPDGTVMQPGRTYPLDTGRRFHEVTIRWAA